MEEVNVVSPHLEHRDRSKSDSSYSRLSGEEEKEVNSACFKRISHMMNNKYIRKFAPIIYWVLLCDCGIVCIILLVTKVIDDEFWKNWSPSFADLGNWNLQLANCSLVLSYAMQDFLALRICLAVACTMFVFYGFTSPVGVMLDMIFFNMVMVFLNLNHAFNLIYSHRYIKFRSKELEEIYQGVFSEFLNRTDFKLLADIALLRQEQSKVTLKQRGDAVTSLCIVYEGTVQAVNQNGTCVNKYAKFDFLEAPQWSQVLDLNPDYLQFPISFQTTSDVVFVKWSRESLVNLIQRKPAIKSALRAVLGIQTAHLWLGSIDFNEQNAVDLEIKVNSP